MWNQSKYRIQTEVYFASCPAIQRDSEPERSVAEPALGLERMPGKNAWKEGPLEMQQDAVKRVLIVLQTITIYESTMEAHAVSLLKATPLPHSHSG